MMRFGKPRLASRPALEDIVLNLVWPKVRCLGWLVISLVCPQNYDHNDWLAGEAGDQAEPWPGRP